jgi:glucoamylase
LYTFVSPHIKNNGHENNGWLGEYKGVPMLFAKRDGVAIAVGCSVPWKKRSVGFKETSDGYKELQQNRKLVHEYEQANHGNVMLVAEIDTEGSDEIIIAVGFGSDETAAANHAVCSLLDGFHTSKEKYIAEWKRWQKQLGNVMSSNNTIGKNFRVSAAVLRMNESKDFPGGILASMSIPWGEVRTEDDLGGYHLVWPRDLVESSWGLLALDSKEDALRIVNYLVSTQEANGRWPQNMWLDGTPYWTGLQMDQVALPLLIMSTCYHYRLLDVQKLKRYWESIRLAAGFILANGPATQQDRWEIQSGISPFTIATEIAGLLAAAEFADMFEEYEMANYCRETADFWNENIETWTYAMDTDLSKKFGVDGYYIRINPTALPINEVKDVCIRMSYLKDEKKDYPAVDVISTDALALVRFGLRKADDPAILNTIKLIDGLLKVETPGGPCWHRFTYDAYGEDEEGKPFYNVGVGRAWPLLTGERAHYEVAAKNLKEARRLLQAMEAFSYHGMIPEQIWDTADIPEKGLFFGKYTGSAMPLTWAHAEYIKLCRSIRQKKIFDMPQHTYERYIINDKKSDYSAWRFTMQLKKISKKKKFLRIEVMAASSIVWSADNWKTKSKTDTKDTGFGIHIMDISLGDLYSQEIVFTFFWKEANKWENKDFRVAIVD